MKKTKTTSSTVNMKKLSAKISSVNAQLDEICDLLMSLETEKKSKKPILVKKKKPAKKKKRATKAVAKKKAVKRKRS